MSVLTTLLIIVVTILSTLLTPGFGLSQETLVAAEIGLATAIVLLVPVAIGDLVRGLADHWHRFVSRPY